MQLGCSIEKLDRFVNSLIDLTAICEKEWNSVPSSKKNEKKNRYIDELGADCYHFTRFSPSELHELYDHLFGNLPDDGYIWHDNKFGYEETLLIALHYMSKGTTYSEMKQTYGGDWTRYSFMVNFFAKFVFHKYYHRLCGKAMEFWSPKVNEFRKAIWEYYVCFDNEGRQDIHVPFDRFRVYGWIDCLMHLMCMPGSGPINDNDERNENAFDIQRVYFSNYAKGWGMKTQAVGLPNGMFGSIFLHL